MPCAAYLFDVEHIFFDGTAWHRWVHQQARSLGSPVGYEAFCRSWRRSWLPRVYGGLIEYWEALEAFLREQQLTECQVQELLTVALSRQKQAMQNSRPLPGIQNCLSSLRQQGSRIAVICNSIHTSETMLQRLNQIGIRVPLDACLTSRTAGRELPDAAALAQLLDQLGVAAADTVYVSTSEERLAIAARAGLRTVRIDLPARPEAEDGPMVAEPRAPRYASHSSDFVVPRIEELPAIVERSPRGPGNSDPALARAAGARC